MNSKRRVDYRAVPGPGETAIRGRISNIFYSDSDFAAGELTVDSTREVIRFSGEIIIGLNDRVEVIGEWILHDRFGRQFWVKDFEYL